MTPNERAGLVEFILDDVRLEISSDRRQIGRELETLSDLALTALARKLYASQSEPVKAICVGCVEKERTALAVAAKPKKKRARGAR